MLPCEAFVGIVFVFSGERVHTIGCWFLLLLVTVFLSATSRYTPLETTNQPPSPREDDLSFQGNT